VILRHLHGTLPVPKPQFLTVLVRRAFEMLFFVANTSLIIRPKWIAMAEYFPWPPKYVSRNSFHFPHEKQSNGKTWKRQFGDSKLVYFITPLWELVESSMAVPIRSPMLNATLLTTYWIPSICFLSILYSYLNAPFHIHSDPNIPPPKKIPELKKYGIERRWMHHNNISKSFSLFKR